MVATKQTRLKLRRGFVKVPLTYRILAVDQLSEADKKLVAKTLVKIKTEVDAKKLVGIGSKWGYEQLAYKTDRVGVIKYKGIEVSLMYKRVTLVLQPLPEDPVPEGTLPDSEDVWIRHDLFGMSVRQQHQYVRTEIESAEKESGLLQIESDAKDKIIASLQKQIKSQQTIIAKKINESIKDEEIGRYVRSTILQHQNDLVKAATKRRK
jgi:hypothetical protein